MGGSYNADVGTPGHGNTASVTISGGTVNAKVYAQYMGNVFGEARMTLSGGTATEDVSCAYFPGRATGGAAVSVSGDFSTTGNGVIQLRFTSTGLVDITDELDGEPRSIKLLHYGSAGMGRRVALAANSAHADATKFIFSDNSGERPLIAGTSAEGGGYLVVAYPVSVTVNKDGSAWSGLGNITLYLNGTLITTLSGDGASRSSLVSTSGTYDVYIGGGDSGIDIEVGDGSANSAEINYYTVSFDTNGGTPVPSSFATIDDSHIAIPPTPTKGLDTFIGWFSDAELENPWEFGMTVTDTVTLYAAWEPAPTPTVDGTSIYGNGAELFISEKTPSGGVPTTYVCTGGYYERRGISAS